MDLKQPISPSSLGSRSRDVVYPTKDTINLVGVDSTRARKATEVGLFLVVLVLIGIFAKFAVVDPLAGGMRSSADLSQAEAQLAQLTSDNADYAEVNREYAQYVVTGLTDEERNLADRDGMLDLLETTVMTAGYPSSVKIVDNTATVSLLGVDLDQVSRLVLSLNDNDRVAYVTVSTARGETDAGNSATVVITFKGALDDAGADAPADADGNGEVR